MKVIGNTGQMPEEWIRDDVHEIIVQTGRMPKLVYLINQADSGGVILRTGAHVTRGWMDSFQLHTECGPVDIISDVGCPVGRAHRMYRCPCGQLYSDDSSHSGKCVNCMMARAVEQIEALGSKPDHWNLDADMREKLNAAQAARAEARSKDFHPAWQLASGYPRPTAKLAESLQAFAGVDRNATPENLSGATLAEPSFDYAKAMRDGHEAMKRQVRTVEEHPTQQRGPFDYDVPDYSGILKAPFESPPVRVGDTVRWWPDGHKDGQALVDRYIDGTVTTMRPLCIKVTGSHGFLERVMGGYCMPAHGGVVDTSVSPGTVQRLNPEAPKPEVPPDSAEYLRRAMQERAARAAVRAASIDPLDVEYDEVKLRELLCRDQIMRQSDCRGSDNAPWPSFTTVQRAAVSAHWSAELRAKVKAGAAADRARAPSVVVDHED